MNEPALALEVEQDDEADFERLLAEATARELARPSTDRHVDGKLVAWSPQEGSQVAFLSCPLFECLYHGTRGPGKTDALLMDFAQHVGQGLGESWRGIVFRQTYPQLADLAAKSVRWFRQIFPNAKFVRSKPLRWEFETGEVLFMSYMRNPDDYWNYHGHEYPWIGWEEMTNWADDRCFKIMMSCCRSSNPDVPRKIRGTTNPYGVGHNWVKERYGLHGKWWTAIVTADAKDLDGKPAPVRCAIHGHIDENLLLLKADPSYKQTIAASAENEAMAAAWLNGSWDFVAGGMFSDVWSHERNSVPPFVVPKTWRIDRAFDWGSSAPFSVGWYAQSDGSDLEFPDGRVVSTVRGDLFRICEWYGWTGRANEGLRMLAVEVAEGIVERELLWGWRRAGSSVCRVVPGPADSSIYTVEPTSGRSIGIDMDKPIRLDGVMHPGVAWTRADKSPGSRVAGWEQCRAMIKAVESKRGVVRESPAFFVVAERCPQFMRTVLALPRDEKNLDDVDTHAEDHAADEFRYRVRSLGVQATGGRTVGMH